MSLVLLRHFRVTEFCDLSSQPNQLSARWWNCFLTCPTCSTVWYVGLRHAPFELKSKTPIAIHEKRYRQLYNNSALCSTASPLAWEVCGCVVLGYMFHNPTEQTSTEARPWRSVTHRWGTWVLVWSLPCPHCTSSARRRPHRILAEPESKWSSAMTLHLSS